MIVICPNCTTRLQLEAAKVPSRAFSVRCPKCQHIVNAQPPAQSAAQRDALAAGGDVPASAQPQQPGGRRRDARDASVGEPQQRRARRRTSDVLRLLASLLGARRRRRRRRA